MEQLADNFNKAFPGMQSTPFKDSCRIEELENSEGSCFQQIEFTGFDGFIFPHELAAKASSFAQIAKHKGVLTCDCDGIILCRKDGQKYMILCELKSTYSSQEITHAKDQLIGSYVKMKGLLSTLQGYDCNEYKHIGIIVSFEPTQEQLTAISKLDNKASAFALSLNSSKTYSMPADKCNRFFHPLAVGDFVIHYVAVPNRNKTHSIDIGTIIR